MTTSSDRSRYSRRDFITMGVGAVGAIGLSGLVGCGSSDAAGTATTVAGSGGTPTKGGILRFGYNQATPTDSLDVTTALNDFEIATGRQISKPLIQLVNGEFVNVLAEEVSIESATEVVVRLKSGLEFHNGKSITADDVFASYARMLDPEVLTSPYGFLQDIDMSLSEVVDPLTVRFVLSRPNVFILNGLAHQNSGIYPGGVWDEATPVGCGPWKVKTFTPGVSVEYERFENYIDPPLLDGLIIQNFTDPTALANALTGGTVDAIGKVPAAQMKTFGSDIKVLQAETGGMGPFVLNASVKPFDDVRVRTAFKLLVDRAAMITQLQDGLGKLGNDLHSPFDPVYASDIPQREQDVEQAKALLKEAGAENLEFDIGVSGFIANAEVVLAEQARAAGVTINVKQVDSTTFFAQHYAQDGIYASLWPDLTYSAQVASSLAPGAFYAEGNWTNETFLGLWEDAKQDTDESTRADKLRQMQQIHHDEGPYLIWGFQQEIDAMANNVEGGEPDSSGWPFSGFDFTKVWFS